MVTTLIICMIAVTFAALMAIRFKGEKPNKSVNQKTVEAKPSSLVRKHLRLVERTRDEEEIVKQYMSAGLEFGSAVSDVAAMGECVGFADFLSVWEMWEKKYAELGYRTISIDDFELTAGWGRPIDQLVKQKRDENEKVVFHAEIYRKYYLNQIAPALNLSQLMEDGKAQFGTYCTPSTQAIADVLAKREQANNESNEQQQP